MSSPSRASRQLWNSEAGEVPEELADTDGRPLMDLACRLLDVIVAIVMAVVLAPLILAIVVIVKLESRGPVLFRQERVGRGRRLFRVAKFRTMYHGAGDSVHRDHVVALIASGKPAVKLADDARVTRAGAFLRRTSLDELPQLWNVLRGDMSLVGPRPPIPYEVERYPAHWHERFAVNPGITGLWQVTGRSEVSLQRMIELDIEYVRKRSVWFNAWILLRTVPAVLTGRGAG
jgi:lipopolysaccharide/colanic/teichoic acid biosynthesis glycosyltransferase